VAEGSAYAVFAGFIGAALGVIASIGIAAGLNRLFGEFFEIEAYIRPRSLIVAYLLGLVITFAAVALSSWKISRLNIVAAVRDVPEIPLPKRHRSYILWGVLLTVLGASMTITGRAGDLGTAIAIGMSLLPFGVALILRFLAVSPRWVFTAVGIYLLVFLLLPEEPSQRLFGEYDTGIEMFFISGMFLVLGATIVIVQNTDVIPRFISWAGGKLFPSQLPAVRTAIAYPAAARGRTGHGHRHVQPDHLLAGHDGHDHP
jgi:putative ABC transport system permease protein